MGVSAVVQSFMVVTALVQSDGAELKPGKGRDIVAAACTQCHTAQNIVASHMSRKVWDTTITWMQDTQGLAELEPDVRAVILDYLVETQGLDSGDEDAASSPWAAPLYRPNPIW